MYPWKIQRVFDYLSNLPTVYRVEKLADYRFRVWSRTGEIVEFNASSPQGLVRLADSWRRESKLAAYAERSLLESRRQYRPCLKHT